MNTSGVVGYDVLVGTCCFEGMWCLHLQGQATQEENLSWYVLVYYTGAGDGDYKL
jgi:hypothetical protein